MVKTIYSIIITVAILILAGVGEQIYIKKTFDCLNQDFTLAYEKIQSQEATVDDANAIKTAWLEKKKLLHLFISHNDVKELDLWVFETVAYVRAQNFKEAISKIEVAINLTEQIPRNYLIRIENIL
ncbi:MAG: DUF4363 family protein [Clostridia bacterium]|nr:DUF4363 family protein [Clostridia bacterium]